MGGWASERVSRRLGAACSRLWPPCRPPLRCSQHCMVSCFLPSCCLHFTCPPSYPPRQHCTASPPPPTPVGLEWGQEGWRRMTWAKVFVLDVIVDWGFNLVVSDVDVVWFKDPLPLLSKHPEAGKQRGGRRGSCLPLNLAAGRCVAPPAAPHSAALHAHAAVAHHLHHYLTFLPPSGSSAPFENCSAVVRASQSDSCDCMPHAILRLTCPVPPPDRRPAVQRGWRGLLQRPRRRWPGEERQPAQQLQHR